MKKKDLRMEDEKLLALNILNSQFITQLISSNNYFITIYFPIRKQNHYLQQRVLQQA
jgi:hypothetical protein